MKLIDLMEEEIDPKVITWFKDHFMTGTILGGKFNPRKLTKTAHGFSYRDFLLLEMKNEEIKYPLDTIDGWFWLLGSTPSLKNGPRIVNGVCNFGHLGLTSLEHAPEKVNGEGLFLNFNKLTSLDNFPKYTKKDIDIDIGYNHLSSLKNINQYIPSCNVLNISGNPLKSNLLSLLKIEGLKVLHAADIKKDGQLTDAHQALTIIKKHLGKGRAGILEAQQELFDADLDVFAEF